MRTEQKADRPSAQAGRERAARQLPPPPPAAVMGLLNYLTATSLDEDYAHVSRTRGDGGGAADGSGPGRRRPRRPGRAALLVLAAFGLLVATAAVQTSRSADDSQSSHDELVKQVVARKAQLADRRERVDDLTNEVRTLETQNLDASVEGRAVQARLTQLGLNTGAEAARGPGVRIEANNGPADNPKAEILDVDLQKMVNGLWFAGAEAIAINGQRLSNLSAIRLAGSSITVNYDKLAAPYSVTAIGDPDTLASRFVESPGGQWWLDLRALYGVTFDIETVSSGEKQLTVPPAPRLDLRFAHTPEKIR
ncbi:DUF881 domain-containing protein [Nocardioides mesophilus]|uniref:DUF881 domain-containing protein n=1 Tax=Nocardioides mesophilus TaxID=433659 RepID=A0A7G9RAR5_9ACTN|nr:DUF881 domain-containing protein [Nocardioides mesophilus]QNN52690.1 DUF881 domain-containing protein [Nocardioides mesophilus]